MRAGSVDLTLARTYRPALVLFSKTALLMIVHHALEPILTLTERYTLIGCMLYVDSWMDIEFIFETNSCMTVVAASLLIQDVRALHSTATKEPSLVRIQNYTVTSTFLASWFVVNCLTLFYGEAWIQERIDPSKQYCGSKSVVILPEHIRDEESLCTIPHSSQTKSSVLFLCGNALFFLLLSNSEIAPGFEKSAIQDNIRVWSFVFLSVAWMYSLNLDRLRYSTLNSFNPCMLRFGSVLFMTSFLPCASAVVVLTAITTLKYLSLTSSSAAPMGESHVPPTKTQLVDTDTPTKTVAAQRLSSSRKKVGHSEAERTETLDHNQPQNSISPKTMNNLYQQAFNASQGYPKEMKA